MGKRNIIVVGASAGGFDAIKKLVAGLPENFDACILIVWHMSPDVKGVLPQVLNKLNTLPASHARDKEPLLAGRIYIAPPDHHMLIDDGMLRITRGPKENRFRPAIDPLFRSAAASCGPRVIGVILSGSLDDGSAGLWTVKQHGGIAIVQEPLDAEVAAMPENAIAAVKVDYMLPVKAIPGLLATLVTEEVSAAPAIDRTDAQRTKMEVEIAMEDTAHKYDIPEYGELTRYTCPIATM